MLLADALRGAAVPAWLFCLICLSPAVLRLMRQKARYLDPIWGVVFMLGLNRLLFISRVSMESGYVTAIILAVSMGCVSLSYQRHDR